MRSNFGKSTYLLMLEGGKDVLTDANYPASGSYIDVSEFESFVFLIGLDTIVTPDFAVYQDTSATQTASIKAVTGASKTNVVTGDDGKWFSIEVETARLDAANGFRYVTLTVSGTGGADNANVWFIGNLPRRVPVTQHANYLEEVLVAG